jgi:hypothetical protein
VNHAEQILNDAVLAAQAAQQSNPNFTTLMQAVGDALSQVIAIVDTYTQSPTPVADGGAPASVPKKIVLTGPIMNNIVDLKNAYSSLKSWGVKLH